MTRRVVALVAPEPAPDNAFPSPALRAAMVEDVYEMVAGLALIQPVLAVPAHSVVADDLAGVLWPGTLLLPVPRGSSSYDILAHLAEQGADEAVLVAGDAPDLPPLLVGKLFRALGTADVAVLPADGGGLVGLAARCPLPTWLAGSGAGLDVAAAQTMLQQAAPRRSAVALGPGWHRVRRPEDLRQLDPGLEGWEITQAALRDPANGAPVG